jgi:hypothetical protein
VLQWRAYLKTGTHVLKVPTMPDWLKISLVIGGLVFGGMAFTLPALAFDATPPLTYDGSRELECAIVRTSDGTHDVYKTVISISFDGSTFKNLNIWHTVRDGTEYDRTAQYENGVAWWRDSDLISYNWSGTRQGLTMFGHVFHGKRDGWWYTEDLWKGNRHVFQMAAVCHETGIGDRP